MHFDVSSIVIYHSIKMPVDAVLLLLDDMELQKKGKSLSSFTFRILGDNLT